MKVILFDIDGTLVRTGRAGVRACNHIFETMFSVKEAASAVRTHGRTDPLILDEIAQRELGRSLTGAELRDFEERYCERLEHELASGERAVVLPGVSELLERLTERGDTLIGLQTGNFERSGRAKLRAAGIEHLFRFGGFAVDHGARHEIVGRARRQADELMSNSASNSNYFTIGDTPHDIDAGRHHGFGTIAVATGVHSVDELRRYGADAVFSDLADVDAVLSVVFGEHRRF